MRSGNAPSAAPQSVLDAARGNALREHAQKLLYMEQDLAEGISGIVFEDTSIFKGTFYDAADRIAEKLDDPAWYSISSGRQDPEPPNANTPDELQPLPINAPAEQHPNADP